MIETTTKLKTIYVIYDPLDGAHLFSSLKKAKETLKEWEKEGGVFDMTGPYKYILDKGYLR